MYDYGRKSVCITLGSFGISLWIKTFTGLSNVNTDINLS